MAALLASLSLVLVGGDAGQFAWSLVYLPVWVVVAKLLGLYDRDHRALRHLTLDEVPQLVLWALIGTLGPLGLPRAHAGRTGPTCRTRPSPGSSPSSRSSCSEPRALALARDDATRARRDRRDPVGGERRQTEARALPRHAHDRRRRVRRPPGRGPRAGSDAARGRRSAVLRSGVVRRARVPGGPRVGSRGGGEAEPDPAFPERVRHRRRAQPSRRAPVPRVPDGRPLAVDALPQAGAGRLGQRGRPRPAVAALPRSSRSRSSSTAVARSTSGSGARVSGDGRS